MKDLEPVIRELKLLDPVVRQISEQMALVDAKVDAARKQVAELQVASISERTADDGAGVVAEGQVEAPGAVTPEESEQNWEMLRQLWRRNARRIEYTIDQISDGRKRLSYDRIPRTKYRRIVQKLQEAGLIPAAAATASIDLLNLFNTYRPKNRKVPNSVVGTLKVLDAQLDKELVDYTKVVAADPDDAADDDPGVPAIPPMPVQDSMARPGRQLPEGNSGARRPT